MRERVGEYAQQRLDVARRHCFVERNGHMRAIDMTQIDRGMACGLDDLRRQRAGVHQQCIEVGCIDHADTSGHQTVAQRRRRLVDASRNRGNACRAMPQRIHAGHHGQKDLCGADVRSGLFPAKVLLARLQRQPKGGVALRILGNTDEAPGHVALERILAGHETRVWAPKPERNAKALRRADRDVRTPLARG